MQESEQQGADYDAFRKRQIVEAAERLLEGRSFDQLTVKAICDEAGISRPTFYHYFEDKFDVAQWFWDLAGEHYLRECGRTLSWYESNVRMLRVFQDHAAFFGPATSSDRDRNACINHGYRRRVEYLEGVVRELNPMLLTDDLRFQINFFTDAESRAIAEWVGQGMPCAPEQLAHRIELCVPRQLHDLIALSCKSR